MRSKVYGLRALLRCVGRTVRQITDDNVALYAAQASFFVMISAVPFISLLVSVLGIILPSETADLFEGLPLPEGFSTLFETVADDLRTAPNVSLLSVSAITTLWSASRGISAIRSGVERVYRAERTKGIFTHRLRSLVSTLMFIVMLALAVALMLFGEPAYKWLSRNSTWLSSAVLRLRTPFFIAALCIMFTVMYASTARRSTFIKHNVIRHVPGAVFSSVGWTLFSYFYSLYITHFPSASYVYGGLAALCFIMLWLYFCMMILLLGAELNKLFFAEYKG